MAWIANTSFSDGIAVVAFATTLFLIFFGIVCFVRWIFRLITGRADPEKMEAVVLILRKATNEEDVSTEAFITFGFYLHTKLAGQQIGRLTDADDADGEDDEDNEIFLIFTGHEADRIWGLLEGEIKEYSPTRPKRVILERKKKNGGRRVIDEVSWHPTCKLDFQIPSGICVPERWLKLSIIGRTASVLGIAGLFGWKILRTNLGLSENEFMKTGLGMTSACLVGIILVSGLSLSWVCGIRIRAISSAAAFADVEPVISRTLKYVLLIVIAIFGLIFLMI